MRKYKPLVILRGPILTLSGYGIHAKQLGSFLLSQERAGRIDLVCEALPWGMTTWIVDRDRDPVVRGLMERCRPPSKKPDLSLQLQLPNEWNPTLAHYNVGVTAAVETSVAPLEWVSCCERMDKVIFPSKHARDSIVNAGWKPSNEKCHIVPESFPDALLASPDVATSKQLDDLPLFTFLVFGQMTTQGDAATDRKNIFNTVKWLLEEFAGDPEVGVLIKTNIGRNNVFDAYHSENILKATFAAASKNVGSKKLPTFKMIHGDMRDDEIAALYKHPRVKALVSATRGEGFGLPLLEAAACDLPVIATGWSAHREFLELGRYVDLPCTLQTIPKNRVDGRIFVTGAQWAEVREDDFKRRLRKFRTSSATPREWAKELGVKIRTTFCRENIDVVWSSVLGSRFDAPETK